MNKLIKSFYVGEGLEIVDGYLKIKQGYEKEIKQEKVEDIIEDVKLKLIPYIATVRAKNVGDVEARLNDLISALQSSSMMEKRN